MTIKELRQKLFEIENQETEISIRFMDRKGWRNLKIESLILTERGTIVIKQPN